MRVAVDVLRVEPDQRPAAPAPAALRLPFGAASGWISNGSPMMSPTVIRGFSEVYGSCITICMLRRSRRSSPAAHPGTGPCPRGYARPAVGVSSRISSLASVDLPQPDSPTRPSVSPRRSSKLTPSTALHRADLPLEQHALGDREVLDQVVDREDRSRRGPWRLRAIDVTDLLREVAGAGPAVGRRISRRHGRRRRPAGRTGSGGGTGSRSGWRIRFGGSALDGGQLVAAVVQPRDRLQQTPWCTGGRAPRRASARRRARRSGRRT